MLRSEQTGFPTFLFELIEPKLWIHEIRRAPSSPIILLGDEPIFEQSLKISMNRFDTLAG